VTVGGLAGGRGRLRDFPSNEHITTMPCMHEKTIPCMHTGKMISSSIVEDYIIDNSMPSIPSTKKKKQPELLLSFS
jgi:hypothetical protein